jgi:Fur family ferric uptake transcriptional regulator
VALGQLMTGRQSLRAVRGGVAARKWHREPRVRGYRLTARRELVLQAVIALGHTTPEAIAERVRQGAEGLGLFTVYRTPALFEELSIVTHAHLGHGASSYHVASDADHLHLVRRGCGVVTEVAPEVIADVDRPADAQLTTAAVRHFAIFDQRDQSREGSRCHVRSNDLGPSGRRAPPAPRRRVSH